MKNILLAFVFVSVYICVQAQYVCPRHMVDCSYGCGRFTDNNTDGFCDFGKLSKDLKNTDTIVENTPPKDTLNNNVKVEDTKKDNKTKEQKNKPKEQITNIVPNKSIDTLKNDKNSEIIVKDTIEIQKNELQKIEKKKIVKKPYNLVSISLVTFLLYFFTLFLAQKQKIKKVTHRRIWNIMLLLTFLVSGLFGLLLVVQINYNFVMEIFRTILYWHVQFGIAMSLIAIFHFLWHLKYYLNIFKKKSDDKLC